MIPSKTPTFVRKYFTSFVWEKPNIKNQVYLSFDDGPIPEVTPWLLDILKAYQVKATFFCVGENVSKNPKLFLRILKEGHSIGNHTYNHLKAWNTKTADYIENIDKTNKILLDLGCEAKLFRPPYGQLKPQLTRKIIALGYQVIMWTILSKDYNAKLSSSVVYDNIVQNVFEGAIIVCHDNLKSKVHLNKILPNAIENLLNRGYNFGKL